MATIKIDAKKMAAYLERAGMDHVLLSRKIGRCDQYIQKCMKNEKMAGPAYEFMIRTLNLPADAFTQTEVSAPPPADLAPYSVTLDVHPEKVRMGLSFMGDEIYHAYAKVKGTNELDLIQSISYAAHMLYKMAEQSAMRDK